MIEETSGIELPQLQGKAKYRLVLRLNDYRPLGIGVFGGKIPTISTRSFCICCDKPSGLKIEVDPVVSGNKVLEKPIKINSCSKCVDHLIANDWQVRLSALLLLVGPIFTALVMNRIVKYGADETSYWMLTAGILITGIAIFLMVNRTRLRRKLKHGHHPFAAIYTIRNSELIIETSNPRVIRELAEDHAAVVAHVESTDVKLRKGRF